MSRVPLRDQILAWLAEGAPSPSAPDAWAASGAFARLAATRMWQYASAPHGNLASAEVRRDLRLLRFVVERMLVIGDQQRAARATQRTPRFGKRIYTRRTDAAAVAQQRVAGQRLRWERVVDPRGELPEAERARRAREAPGEYARQMAYARHHGRGQQEAAS